MRRKVNVIPQPDGTLIVNCGEDELEVVIVKPVQLGFPVWNFAPEPIVGPRQGGPIYINPNDETMMLARPWKFDTYSTQGILSALTQVHQDPGAVNPTSLVVGPTSGIDLHNTVAFAGQMQTHFPDVGFTIDLGLARHIK